MVMRIATFNTKPDVDPIKYAEFCRWMGCQPGMITGYHAQDAQTGKYLSVSVWESRESVMALKDRQFPGGPMNLKPDAVALLDVSSTFGPSAAKTSS